MGYDLARFVSPKIDDDLMCPICMSVLENPVETPCEHAFCRGCLLQWLERRRRCPLDQTVLSGDHLCQPSRLLINQLGRLEIRCPFREQGCRETMHLEFEPAHRLKCPHNPHQGAGVPRSSSQLPPRHGRRLADEHDDGDEDLASFSGAAAVGLVGLAGVLGAVVAGVMGYQRGKASRHE